LGYFWWGTIEGITNATPNRNIESLKCAIFKVWAEYPADTVCKACSSLGPILSPSLLPMADILNEKSLTEWPFNILKVIFGSK